VQCTSPALAAGLVTVQISLNGGADWTPRGATFIATELPHLDDASTLLGPATGGSELLLRGAFVSESSAAAAAGGAAAADLACDFGRGARVPARWLAADLVACLAPAADERRWREDAKWFLVEDVAQCVNVAETSSQSYYDGRSARKWLVRADACATLAPIREPFGVLAVTVNGQELSNPLVYAYHAPLVIAAARPLTGPVSGGTMVYVDMYEPLPSALAGQLTCWFGETDARSPISVSLDRLQVVCEAPPAAQDAYADGTWSDSNHIVARLRLSTNGGTDFSIGEKDFHYHDEVSISSLEPRSGPALGGTVIVVTGQSLDRLSEAVFCVFSDTGGARVATRAYIRSSLSLECASPAAAVFSNSEVALDLALTQDLLQLTAASLRFSYDVPVRVVAVTPRSGPSTGGTQVLVQGGPFEEYRRDAGLFRCRFGDSVVDAEWRSTHELACQAPLLEPVSTVEAVRLRGGGPRQRVERITIASDPRVDERATVELALVGRTIASETQTVTVAPLLPALEVQAVQLTRRASNRAQVLQLATSASALAPETYELRVQAHASSPHEPQELQQQVFQLALRVDPSQLLPEVNRVLSLRVWAADQLGGSFSLQVSGVTGASAAPSAVISATATASAVQLALAALGLPTVVVTSDAASSLEGVVNAWQVTFPLTASSIVLADALIAVNATGLTGTGAGGSAVVLERGGRCAIQTVVLPRVRAQPLFARLNGGVLITSSALATGDDVGNAATVRAWLATLWPASQAGPAPAGAITVSLNHDYGSTVAWDVAFIMFPGHLAPLAFTPAASGVADATPVRNGTTSALTGSLTLRISSPTGGSALVAVHLDQRPDLVQASLAVAMRNAFPAADPALFQANMAPFAGGMLGQRDLQIELPGDLGWVASIEDTSRLLGTRAQVTLTQVDAAAANPPLQGSFSLSVVLSSGLVIVGPIAFDATAFALQSALQAAVPTLPLAAVSKVRDSTLAQVWSIELLPETGVVAPGRPVAVDIHDASQLFGGGVGVERSQRATVFAVQSIQTDSFSQQGRLSGTWDLLLPHTGERVRSIAYDASAASLAAAIAAQAPKAGAVSVTRSSTSASASRNGYRWELSFTERSGPVPRVVADTSKLLSNLAGDSSLAETADVRIGTGAPLSGSFRVSCAAGECPRAAAVSVPFNASDEHLKALLDTLLAQSGSAAAVAAVTKSAPTINGAASWAITFASGVADALPPTLDVERGTGAQQLQGSGAMVTVTTLSAASVAEVQTLSVPLSVPDPDCHVLDAAGSSQPLPVSYSSSEAHVVAAFAAATGERVVVSRPSADSNGLRTWRIAYVQRVGDVSDTLVTCTDPGVAVATLVQGTGVGISGSFHLSLAGRSVDVPVAASAQQLQNALRSSGVLPGAIVTAMPQGLLGDVNGDNGWLVTFAQALPPTVPLRGLPSNTLAGTNAAVVVSIVQRASRLPEDCQFSLKLRGEYTALLNCDADADLVLRALEGMEQVTRARVVRSINATGAVAWTVTLQHFLPELKIFTQNLGPQPLVEVELTTSNSSQPLSFSADVVRDQAGTLAPQGAIVLAYADAPALTQRIVVDADRLGSGEVTTAFAAAVMALRVGGGMPTVVQTGPDASGNTVWEITLPWANGPYPALLASGADFAPDVAVNPGSIAVAYPPLHGTFKLTWDAGNGNWPTLPIAFDAATTTAATIEAALEALSGNGLNDVNVSSPLAWTDSGVQFDVTFVRHSLNGANPLELLGVDLTGLAGSAANVHSTVEIVTLPSYNERQEISLGNAVGGSIDITLPPQWLPLDASFAWPRTVTVPWNATPQQVQTALQAVFDAYEAHKPSVAVSVLPSGAPGWVVESIATLGPLPLLVLDDSGLHLPSGGHASVSSAIVGTTAPLSGSFDLLAAGPCYAFAEQERQTQCATQRVPLAVDAEASDLRAALALALGEPEDAIEVNKRLTDDFGGREWAVTFMDGRNAGTLSIDQVAPLLVGTEAPEVHLVRHGNRRSVGTVTVAVSVNGGAEFSPEAAGAVFTYQPVVHVRGVYPTHGPVSGGTRLLVVGEFFPTSSAAVLACRFAAAVAVDGGISNLLQSMEADAQYLNSTHVLCTAPASHQTGPFTLQVGHRGASSWSPSRTRFTFDEPLRVLDISPRSGPASGPLQVELTGSGFLPTDELACGLGPNVRVRAVWLDSHRVRCTVPLLSGPGRLAVSVSNNGLDFARSGLELLLYAPPAVSGISPLSGPAWRHGTTVTLRGSNFADVAQLSCRFDRTAVVPATYVSSEEVRCMSPALVGPLNMLELPYVVRPDGSQLFPASHVFPAYPARLVDLEVSNNGHDWHATSQRFLYQQDVSVSGVWPARAYSSSTSSALELFVAGQGFVNSSTALRCRVGASAFPATFLTPQTALCHARLGPLEVFPAVQPHEFLGDAGGVFAVEMSVNGGADWSFDLRTFEHLGPCPGGRFCPAPGLSLRCPPGTYCPGTGNANFTLCPAGTYTPLAEQKECLRCPIGYACPDMGMHVPRICPAGFVCDVTGIDTPRMPCPEGHFCLEGTATTATSCGDPSMLSAELTPSRRYGELAGTLRRGRHPEGGDLVLGARNSACWSNATDDLGLQVSPWPARFWQERHLLPLDPDSPFQPVRGRFCLDDACLRLDDMLDLKATDYAFTYHAFALRRPVPCPAGAYCAPGTAAGGQGRMHNFSTPQPCFESMYCPEGSGQPRGVGEGCPRGHHCPFGDKLPCPVGTYCPRDGMDRPLPCPPTTFNGMVGQQRCSACAPGYICPGFGRVAPAACPPGYVCSQSALASPDMLCPAGFYCANGTLSADPFRNDTTLRPYPCAPGSYCPGGVGYDEVREGDFLYSQPCAPGFYCELASVSPKGAGLCPKGFVCPKGTATPIPTEPGTFAEMLGTVQAAKCLPGYYAPTIETITCYPCPAGTECTNDGTYEALICPPGTYRTITRPGESVVCKGCPAGTWSKNWELRDAGECTRCPPGVNCPVDGMTFPCAISDLPTPYTPTGLRESEVICLQRGAGFYFGYVQCPVDDRGRSPNFEASNDPEGTVRELSCTDPETHETRQFRLTAQCYQNAQPLGSAVYQRFKDYHGPRYEIQSGGVYHQGYGDQFYEGYWGRGSLYIEQPVSDVFLPGRNCTSGYFFFNASTRTEVWRVGTCEADLICNYDEKPQAQPCAEGYSCGPGTDPITALDVQCAEGYYCNFGTTADVSLEAPNGRYKHLCEEGFYCERGTGVGQARGHACPEGYFCPSGTGDPVLGVMATDALRRGMNTSDSDPFRDLLFESWWDIKNFEPRMISAHDDRCFKGISPYLALQFEFKYHPNGSYAGIISQALKNDLRCGRDHTWQLLSEVNGRGRCDCATNKQRLRAVFEMWQCTRYGICEGASLRGDWDAARQPYMASFEYTGREKVFVQRRRLCAQAIDPNLQCVYDNADAWQTRYNGSDAVYYTAGVDCDSRDMNCICDTIMSTRGAWSEEQRANCKLFKYRNDPTLKLRPTEFFSYDDLKAFVMEAPENEVSDDAPSKIGERLRGLHRVPSWVKTGDYNPYQGALLAQYTVKRTCTQVDECNYIDPLLYDLWTAVRFVDRYGNLTAQLLDSGRLDTCSCQDITRCPDGTWSSVGAKSIYECTKFNAQVLSRFQPFVPYHPFVNMTGWEATNETADFAVPAKNDALFEPFVQDPLRLAGLGRVSLQALDVAVLTVDLRSLLRNMTYNAHYQLSVYIDCEPCKVRYDCAWGLRGAARPPCCKCQRHGLPFFFEDTAHVDPAGFHDDKHQVLQINISPLRDLELVLALELLHGLYYGPFLDLSPAQGDITIHRPARANIGTREQFVMVIDRDDFGTMDLPFNLPLSMRAVSSPLSAAGVSKFEIEDTAFIDRVARVHVGDPDWGVRSNTEFNSSTANATGPDVLGAAARGTTGSPHGGLTARPTPPTRPPTRRPTKSHRRGLFNSVDNLNNEGGLAELDYSIIPGGFSDDVLEYVSRDPSGLLKRDDTWWDNVDGAGSSFFALTYLPFFSNCREYDSRLYLSKLLEMHPAPDCDRPSEDQVIPVSPYPWQEQMMPLADSCRLPPEKLAKLYAPGRFCSDAADCKAKEADYPGFMMSCVYEEEVHQAGIKNRWFEQPAGTTLFYITKFPVAPDDFVGVRGDPLERWGRRSGLRALIGTESLVPVKVEQDFGSQETLVPRSILFSLNYYMRNSNLKSIVSATVRFEDLCTVSDNPIVQARFAQYTPPILQCEEGNYNYTLYFKYTPLPWVELINAFQFNGQVYGIFYAGVGAGSAIVGFVLWLFSRILTRLKHPPPFKFTSFYRVVAFPTLWGVFLASVPVALAGLVFQLWFVLLGSADPLNRPTSVSLEGLLGHWQDTLMPTMDSVETYRSGRIGHAWLVLAVYLLVYGAMLVVPSSRFNQRARDERARFGIKKGGKRGDEDAEDDEAQALADKEHPRDLDGNMIPSAVFRPRFWKRGHIVLCSLAEAMALVVVLEFSYSSTFSKYVIEFLIALKVVQILVSLLLEDVLKDALLVAPLIVCIQITQMTVAMSAKTFLDFVSCYIVELGMMLLERIIITPIIYHVRLMWPKWRLMWRRRMMGSARRKMTRDDRAREAAEWKKVNELIALESEGVEPLLGAFATYVNNSQALVMAPYINLFLIAYNKVTKIPGYFGIRETDLAFYFMFSAVIIPFTYAMDIFLLNTMELIQGFKVYEYVAYQQYRFSVRERRWQMDADTLDVSITPRLQTIDNLCFSSQYYFITGLQSWGIMLTVFALSIFMNQPYVVFADPAMPLITVVVVALCMICRRLLQWLGNKLRIWRLKSVEGTVDDDVAKRLAVGAGRSEDLEAERMELQALNSDRFRHKFLERNRPWILQHLGELLTPRTLAAPGPDGRPNIDYIRDVYNDLLAMGEGKRRPGEDREDVSSDDEEADLEAARRNWSKAPVRGASKAIALLWLGRARQRRTFAKLVKGFMEKQAQPVCAQCGRNEQSGVEMRAELADDEGKAEPRMLDRLIREFEEAYPDKSQDAGLWQAFFRGHARFITRCRICLDQARTAELEKKREALRHPGGDARATRAQDVSSDEDAPDEGVYEPVIVSRSSVEGRAMSKWLLAARRRLGGEFPRPGAREHMELYAKKLKEAKLRAETRARRKELKKSNAKDQDKEDDPQGFGMVTLNAASTALLQLWVRKARKSVRDRMVDKAQQVRKELELVLAEINEEDDWFFGAEFRIEGQSLKAQGATLADEIKALSQDAEVQVAAVEAEHDKLRIETNQQIEALSAEFEELAQKQKVVAIAAAEERIIDMQRLLDDRKQEFARNKKAGLSASERTEVLRKHTEETDQIEANIAAERDRQITKMEETLRPKRDALREETAKLKMALATKKREADDRVMAIMSDLAARTTPKEVRWERAAVVFTDKAKRKLDAKQVEADAREQQSKSKQAASKRRRRIA
jgi:hypothetical protein